MADEYVEVNTFPEFLEAVAESGSKVKLMFDIDVSQYPAYRSGLTSEIKINSSEIDFNGHYISNIVFTSNLSYPIHFYSNVVGLTIKNGGFLNVIVDGNVSNSLVYFYNSQLYITDFKITAMFRNLTNNISILKNGNSTGWTYATRVACDINIMNGCTGSANIFGSYSLQADQIGIRYNGIYPTNVSTYGFISSSNNTNSYAKRTYIIGKFTDVTLGSYPFKLYGYTTSSNFVNSYIAADFVGFQKSPDLKCVNSFIVAEEIEDETVRNLFMNQSYMPVLTKAQAKSSEYLASIGWLP